MTRQALGGSEEALRRAKTTCRCCAAACGMVITLDPADRVLKAEGDRDHPISRGYSCGKGRAIPEMHHSADRLLQPRVRGADCGWDECLASLGQDLGGVIARHGNQAVGVFVGTGGAYDTLGISAFIGFVTALRSPQMYSTASVDSATC